MKELVFDDDSNKNNVIDELVFEKKVLGHDAYTYYDKTYYDNSDLDVLVLLREKKKIQDKMSLEDVKKSVSKGLISIINKTKLTLEPDKCDKIENFCYSVLRHDMSYELTLRLSCYLLLLIQLGKNADEKLGEFLYLNGDSFNIYFSREFIRMFTDKSGVVDILFDKYIYQTEFFNDYCKMSKISEKVFKKEQNK